MNGGMLTRKDQNVMRFRFYNPDRVVPFLEEYAYPRKEYTSNMAEVPEEHPFITEDEINELFSRVGHYSGAKDQLYDFYQSPHTAKEKQDYIKIFTALAVVTAPCPGTSIVMNGTMARVSDWTSQDAPALN